LTKAAQIVVVRRAAQADLEGVLALRLALLEELLPPGAPRPDVEINRAFLSTQLAGDDFPIYVAEAGDAIVATGAMSLYQAPPLGRPEHIEGYIMNMYTRPAWRGRGLARRILDALAAHAQSAGARKIWLRASPMGRPLYVQAGFIANDAYMERTLIR